MVIELNNSHNVNDVVHAIFQTWLVEDVDATWGKLVKCLKDVNLAPLAAKIDSCLQATGKHTNSELHTHSYSYIYINGNGY